MTFKAHLFGSYDNAINFMGRKTDRPYGHGRATRIIRTDNGVGVRYHNTIVVEYLPNGIRLNSGGYRTMTTKSRINDALDCIPDVGRVFQNRGIWYLMSTVFFDGMIVGYDGRIKGQNKRQSDKRIKEVNKQTKSIKAYTKTIADMIQNGTLPAPSLGDCLYCQFREVKTGSPLGEVIQHDHIALHLEESYIVGSLIKRAIEVYGSMFVKGSISHVWSGQPITDWERDILVRDVPRMVARYIKSQLAIAN